MLPASLEHVRTVSLHGLKPTWTITKPADTVTVGTDVFVRVACSSRILNSLVAAGNKLAPDGIGQQAVSRSKGYQALIAQRNHQQSDDLAGQAPECTLFSPSGKEKRKVCPRSEQQALRNDPKVISLSVQIGDDVHEVEVLRPVHPSDNLFVAYKDDMIVTVLHVIRFSEFDTPQHRVQILPKGGPTARREGLS